VRGNERMRNNSMTGNRCPGDRLGSLQPLPPMPYRSASPPRTRRPPATGARRRGSSSIEQLLVLVTLGILFGLACASGLPLLQAVAVETASRETVSLFALARDHALATSARTAVRLDVPRQRVLVHRGIDTLAVADFAQRGVHLEATRDSMAYSASGLGVGAANLRVILTRGSRADTLTVSRLGRVSLH
jgi:Tfp pilus assembly protein FimT